MASNTFDINLVVFKNYPYGNSAKFLKQCVFFHHLYVLGRGPVVPKTSRWWKNFGPDLPLLFELHEIWSVDSPENNYNY